MKLLKDYTIQFIGLKTGTHHFEYSINKPFFDFFEFDDFNDANIKVNVTLEKETTLLKLMFSAVGTVNINCDVSNEPFNQDIKNAFNLVVKFGEEFNNEHMDILILPHGSYELNIQQYIYELIVLSLPAKRVHPGVEDGSLQSEILDKLDELSPDQESKPKDKADPRWNVLNKLLTDKKEN